MKDKINMDELKEEFYSKFVKSELGENQMILLTDEVSELWDWVDTVIRQAHQQGTEYQKKKTLTDTRIKILAFLDVLEEE